MGAGGGTRKQKDSQRRVQACRTRVAVELEYLWAFPGTTFLTGLFVAGRPTLVTPLGWNPDKNIGKKKEKNKLRLACLSSPSLASSSNLLL